LYNALFIIYNIIYFLFYSHCSKIVRMKGQWLGIIPSLIQATPRATAYVSVFKFIFINYVLIMHNYNCIMHSCSLVVQRLNLLVPSFIPTSHCAQIEFCCAHMCRNSANLSFKLWTCHIVQLLLVCAQWCMIYTQVANNSAQFLYWSAHCANSSANYSLFLYAEFFCLYHIAGKQSGWKGNNWVSYHCWLKQHDGHQHWLWVI
jgi:hypothetical protein